MTSSREVEFAFHIIPATAAGDRHILYRPLAGLAFVGNRALADLVLELSIGDTPAAPRGQAARFLQQIGFLQPDPPPPEPMDETFEPTSAVLLLTNQCQLRCTYCYAAAGALPKEELRADLAYPVIDHVYAMAEKLGRPHFELALHGGGEPTFAWSLLKACVDYARRQALPARISLTSNGVWSPAQRRWIIDHLDSVSISLDGAPDTQDKQRPLVNGRGSSALVMETLAALDEANFPYGIRLTATPPFTSLPEDTAYLCAHSRCQYMQVEPAFNVARGGHGALDAAGVEEFVQAYLHARQLAAQAGRQLTYTGARLGQVKTTFCAAPFGSLIVNPRGKLVTCFEVTGDHPLGCLSRVGRLVDGQVVIDHQARRHLHELMAERRAACQDCFCYWSCAGDCYVRTFEEGADGHLNFGPRCQMNRRITAELLLDAIAAGDGVWRRPVLPNGAQRANDRAGGAA